MNPTSAPTDPPSYHEIFLGFSMVGALGFGGVMPWIRWLLVERKRWYKEEEFLDAFSLANVIPGGNVVSISVLVGAQMRGWKGAVVALAGLTLAPAIMVCLLGTLYLRYQDSSLVQSVLAAMAAAGAGLILGMSFRLLRPLLASPRAIGIALAVFATAMLWHLPLVQILLIFGPISLGLAYFLRR